MACRRSSGFTRLGTPPRLSAAFTMRLHCEACWYPDTMQLHCDRLTGEKPMAPETRYAKNGNVSIAYETFGDPATGVPLLGIMGLDFQMVWWPDAFCAALAERGFAVARF